MIYFDNAATTMTCKEANEAISFALENFYGNPSSLYSLGLKSEQTIKSAKETIAKAIGASGENIIFTSGATESNNMAIMGVAKTLGRHKKKIITTSIEHPSVKNVMKELSENGFEIVFINPDENGEINPTDIINAVDDKTCLVSCQYVNNETGYILPIEKAYKSIKRRFPEIILHTDLVQGFMKLPVNQKSLSADLISLSAHKVYGPKGIGALYIKKGVRILPSIFGGGQENGLRSGTESVHNIMGFEATVKKHTETIRSRYDYVSELYSYLSDKLKSVEGAYIHTFSTQSPYVASITVDNIKAETMLHFLESKDIFVSSGSACSRGKKSEILKAFNYDENALDSTIRVSFSNENTKDEIDEFLKALENGIKSLCKIKGVN